MNHLGVAVLMIAIFISGCSRNTTRPPLIVSPDLVQGERDWKTEDLQKDIEVKTLRVTPEASHHLIALRTREAPHFHEFHDLTVWVRKGRVQMHLGDRSREVLPGDVIFIPRKTIHWAENLDPDGYSEAYAIYTPSFDGRDIRTAA